MKIYRLSFLYILLFAVIQCAAQQTSVASTKWNANIDLKSRNEIKLLDDKLIMAFGEGSAQKLNAIYSKQLVEKTAGKTEIFLKTVRPIFSGNKYSLLDECLYNSPDVGGTAKVSKNGTGDNDYNLNFKIYNRETYISLIVYPGLNDKSLITAIYSKYGKRWQLDFIHVGLFSVFGETAIDLYNQAKKNSVNGDLIDAAVSFRLAQQTASPAEKAFVYNKFSEMKDFGTKFYQQIRVKFPLPMKIPGVTTATQMFDIEPAVLNDGIYPVISYVSAIKVQMLNPLTEENEQVKKAILKMSPGVNKNKKLVFFNVYNQFPNGKTPVDEYRFVWKVN